MGFNETLRLTAHGKRLETIKTQKPPLLRSQQVLVKLIKFETGLSGRVLCPNPKAGASEGLQGSWGDGGKRAVTWPKAAHWAPVWTLEKG